MDYQIIYYNASRTGACEKALVACMSKAGFGLCRANAAATKQILGNFLSGGFAKNDLIIVIGSASAAPKDSAVSVLASAINPESLIECIKLDVSGSYMLTCKGQCLLILPDYPPEITRLLETKAIGLLHDFFESSNHIVSAD